jgi:chromosome partitioning protein
MSLSVAVPSRIVVGLGWPRSARWSQSLGWPGDLGVPRETVADELVEPAEEVGSDADPGSSAEPQSDLSAGASFESAESPEASAWPTATPGSSSVEAIEDPSPFGASRLSERRGSDDATADHFVPVSEAMAPSDESPTDTGVDVTAGDDAARDFSALSIPGPPNTEEVARVPQVTEPAHPSGLPTDVPPDDAVRSADAPSGVPSDDVSRETVAGIPAETPVDTVLAPADQPIPADQSMPRPPGPRRAKFDRDEFDAGEVAETPAPNAARSTVPASPSSTLPKPTATRVFVVANQKGGVGKTTTSVNLAAGLTLGGLNVLVLDLDPQGNASTALGIDHSPGVPGTYEVLIEGSPIADHLVASPEAPNLHVLPATIDLAGAEIQLVSMVARENRLRKALRTYLADHPVDYVFLDCPPSLGLITLNALVAASEILIPIQCEYYALEGVSQLVRTINLVKGELNEDLAVSTVLLTMYDARTRLAAQVADEVRAYFTEETLPTVIPRSVRISEAPSYGQTVLTYHPDSAGAVSYLQAAQEIARRGAQGEQ